MNEVVVTVKGRLVIPSELRGKFGIKKGHRFTFTSETVRLP